MTHGAPGDLARGGAGAGVGGAGLGVSDGGASLALSAVPEVALVAGGAMVVLQPASLSRAAPALFGLVSRARVTAVGEARCPRAVVSGVAEGALVGSFQLRSLLAEIPSSWDPSPQGSSPAEIPSS